jgi:hypothetical protein
LALLGIERVPKQVPSLQDYLATKQETRRDNDD